MSRYTSYTIHFTDNNGRERSAIDLGQFVISDFTHHMMGEISGTHRMRSHQQRRRQNGPLHLLPEFASDRVQSRPRIATFKCEGDLGDCSICQVGMKKNDIICRLPCQDTVSHAFHKECITPWLETNDTCPNCRSKI